MLYAAINTNKIKLSNTKERKGEGVKEQEREGHSRPAASAHNITEWPWQSVNLEVLGGCVVFGCVMLHCSVM